MANSKKVQDLILDSIKDLKTSFGKLDEKLDQVRSNDIPAIHTAMQVIKTQVEERTGRKATIITGIGGIIAVCVSIGSAIAVAMYVK